MKKSLFAFTVLLLLLFTSSASFAQSVKIGPRVVFNYNIFNAKNLTLSYNGIGVGIGGNVDVSFNKTIGLLVNLTAFDMRNFSNSVTNGNTTTEDNFTLYYLTFDPMFKAEFSGFYMVAGPSLSVKLGGSHETTTTNAQGGTPQTVAVNYNSVRFGAEVGTGYNFLLSPGMYMATDIMAAIPFSNTIDIPGRSNSVFTLKLGVALKFTI